MRFSFIKKRSARNVLILTLGSVAAQLIVVAFAPIMTRLYSAEQIGVYTLILSITAIFSGIMNCRYDLSIVSESDDSNVLPLMKLSFVIGIVLSILISIGYWIYICFGTSKGIAATTTIYVFFILLSYAIVNTLLGYNIRQKEYKVISSVYVVRVAAQNIGSSLLGLFKTGSIGLLLPYVVGQFLGIGRQARPLRSHWKELYAIDSHRLKKVMTAHKKQPLYGTPGVLASGLSYSSITIFIEQLFGLATVGYYSISVRLLGLPLSIFGTNISKVFLESASREYDESGQFLRPFLKLSLVLCLLAIPMVILMILFSPAVCEYVFGPGWNTAGKYIVYLAPMFGLRLIVSTLMPAAIITQKQDIDLIMQTLLVGSSVASFVLVKCSGWPAEAFLTAISISFSTIYIVYYALLYKCAKGKRISSP